MYPVDPEIAAHLAAIGIVTGKPFNPDARMTRILTEFPSSETMRQLR